MTCIVLQGALLGLRTNTFTSGGLTLLLHWLIGHDCKYYIYKQIVILIVILPFVVQSPSNRRSREHRMINPTSWQLPELN